MGSFRQTQTDPPKTAAQVPPSLVLSHVWSGGTNWRQSRRRETWVSVRQCLGAAVPTPLGNCSAGGGRRLGLPLPRRLHCGVRCGPGPVPASFLSASPPTSLILSEGRATLSAGEEAGIPNGRVGSGLLDAPSVSEPACVCFSPQVPPARTPSSPRCSGRPVNSVLPATMKSGGHLCGTWATS